MCAVSPELLRAAQENLAAYTSDRIENPPPVSLHTTFDTEDLMEEDLRTCRRRCWDAECVSEGGEAALWVVRHEWADGAWRAAWAQALGHYELMNDAVTDRPLVRWPVVRACSNDDWCSWV